MQATVTFEVPPGTDIFVCVFTRARPKRMGLPPDGLDALKPPPRSPRGDQLWLPYPGWERDAAGWRWLDF